MRRPFKPLDAPLDQLPPEGWRRTVYTIVFGTDTRLGRAFDVGLLATIIVSVIAVMLESVQSIRDEYGSQLIALEWFVTIAFSIEYLVRLAVVKHPLRYARSFFGIIDLLAILPTYLTLIPTEHFAAGSVMSLTAVRVLRLLRVFRVLKIAHLLGEANELTEALAAARHRIFVFIYCVLLLVVVLGSAMYVIEGSESGFTSIPRSIYWAIVTMTTVGYGDITPQTTPGQALAAFIMILGYGIIAVPTGIVTAEITNRRTRGPRRATAGSSFCPACGGADLVAGGRFCHHCGAERPRG